MKSIIITLPRLTGAFAVSVIAAFGIVGMHYVGQSSAINTQQPDNPFGYADYCTLENNQTVIYGWQHDTNAPAGALPSVTVRVGSSSVTTATDVSGYRQAKIDATIKYYFPSMPTSSVYGFRAAFSGLYKGTSNPISGTGINYGPGNDVALDINTFNDFSDEGAPKQYFVNSVIPDACLADKPVPAAPVVTPPKAAPKVTPKVTPAPVAAPAVSAAADGIVTAGTTTVTVTAPNGNASNMFVAYGTNASNLARSTEQQAVDPDGTTTITIKQLSAKTTYTYQLVRVLGDQQVHAASATFTTTGYAASLLFVDKNNKPVSGINAELAKPAQQQKSGADGKVTFTGLAAGSYSATFTYQGQLYSQDFTTTAVTNGSDKPVTATLTKTIAVNLLASKTSTAAPVATKPFPWKLVGLSIGGIVILTVLAWASWFVWGIYRRHQSGPRTMPVTPDPIDQRMHNHFMEQQPPAPSAVPEHMGESLRDMVIKSMAAEAAKHKQPPTSPQ